MNGYRTVDGEYSAVHEVKHSRFIATVKGITGFDEGLEFVKATSKKYSDATHNCYAILTRHGEQKFSDDGEPGGTAGTPILNVLKRSELTDVVCVVTRYFGGIKLGVGGLGAAYTHSAMNAVGAAKIITRIKSDIYGIMIAYSEYDRLLRLTEAVKGKVLEAAYGEAVNSQIAVPSENGDAFLEKVGEAFGGKTVPILIATGYESY